MLETRRLLNQSGAVRLSYIGLSRAGSPASTEDARAEPRCSRLHRPCRFIPSPVLLHFAGTDAPERTCRPRFREARGPQARQRDISLRRDTPRRHAPRSRTRRCLQERRIRDPYPDTTHSLAVLCEDSSHNSQMFQAAAREGTSTSLSCGPAILAFCVEPGELAWLPRIRTDTVPPLRLARPPSQVD